MGNCRSKGQEVEQSMHNEDALNRQQNHNNYNTQYDHQQPQDEIVTSQIRSHRLENASSSSNDRPYAYDNSEQTCSPANSSHSHNLSSERHNVSSASDNDTVINSTRAEVSDLLDRINAFEGVSENDKNYKYLDEMLTRCILRLDNIECTGSEDRSNRKQAIYGVNQAISILERKLAINSDMKRLDKNLCENDVDKQ